MKQPGKQVRTIKPQKTTQRCSKEKVLYNFIKTTLHGCSPVNLLHIFRKPLPNNNSAQPLQKTSKVKSKLYIYVHEIVISLM